MALFLVRRQIARIQFCFGAQKERPMPTSKSSVSDSKASKHRQVRASPSLAEEGTNSGAKRPKSTGQGYASLWQYDTQENQSMEVEGTSGVGEGRRGEGEINPSGSGDGDGAR